MPKVSIIVPIYNGEHYLHECLTSIKLQDFPDFECILIDDGSTDSSLSICEKFMASDNRFVVVSQRNSGVTKARFKGVLESKGAWIMFVDCDDLLAPNALSLLLEDSSECDLVIGHSEMFPMAFKWPYSAKNECYSRDEYLRRLVAKRIHGGPCARLFNRELFNDTVFDIPRTVALGEDYIMNIRICQNLRCVRMIDQTVYKYRYLGHDYNQNLALLLQRMKHELQSLIGLRISIFSLLFLSTLTVLTFLKRVFKVIVGKL